MHHQRNLKALKFKPDFKLTDNYAKNFNKEEAERIEHLQTNWYCSDIPYSEAVDDKKRVQAQVLLDHISVALSKGCDFIKLDHLSLHITQNPHHMKKIVALLELRNLKLVYYSGVESTPMGEMPWSQFVIHPITKDKNE